jgi:O-antigen ligase
MGFWLFLQKFLVYRSQRLGGLALLILGLLAAYSRGPWYGAVCVYFAFAALSPGAFAKLLKAALAAILIAIGIYFSPYGAKVLAVLPVFGGQVDSADIDYRSRLLTRTWEIVRDHPLLGDQHALLRMQDLRQGQGIIDLINTYAGVLVGNGFIGLFLFLSFILIALLKSISARRPFRKPDPEFAAIGSCIAACVIGMLLMLENGSFGTGPKSLFYVLAGLAVAYAAVAKINPSSLSDPQTSKRKSAVELGA